MPSTEAEGRGTVGRVLSGLMPSSARLVAWGGAAGLTGFLLWAGRARAHWPWFSLWVLLLIALLAAMALPRTRRALRMSWFGVTLLTLTGVCLANAFLFYVESHRQRSERLEVRGVYHSPSNDVLSIGVGRAGLDVVLEGDPTRFERWGIEVEAARGDTFLITRAREVETLRVRRGDAWGFPANGRTEQVIGDALTSRSPVSISSADGDAPAQELTLLRGGRRGVLAWGSARAALNIDDPLLNRMFGRTLRAGVPLAELAWDSLPDPYTARDLVLTQVAPGRTLGRLTLSLPKYRVVSRASGKLATDGVPVLPGDTLRVTSRGSTWAFALDRVPTVSRVAAPTAVMFVRRPRPGGWALPSAEACGAAVDRCAIISSEALPPPQPHFDLSGFGLDGDAYSFLGRLETESDGVGIVTADERMAFGYGSVQPVAARKADADAPDAGYLMRVHRSDTSSRSAVLLTVLGLYGLFVSALMVLLGNPYLARRLRSESANTSAAWALLNVFIIFLGVRLVLGLRVAYAAPFYDRAAATSVGLWLAFATMLVFLGRWDRWTPVVWRAAARVRRPVRRLLLRPVEPAEAPTTTPSTAASEPGLEDRATRRGRFLAALGIVGMTVCTAGLIWQRPSAGLGLFVAVIALGAWIALGLFGPARRLHEDRGRLIRPVDVLTADFLSTHPSRAFTMAAGIAIVLALAIQAPIVALGPVSAGLVLFGFATLLERGNVLGSSTRRAWGLYGLSVGVGLFGVWLFFGFAWVPWAVSVGGAASLAVALARTPAGGQTTWIARGYDGLLDIGRSIFSGVAWMFVLGALAFLTFLNFQQIPPFIRFALVFMLFLLAVRAGLVCRRVLDDGQPGAPISALGLLVIPVGVLLVFMLFDFGLGLVFFLPMMVTVLLATGIDRLPKTLSVGSAAVLLLVTLSAWSVLNPSVASLRQSDTVAEFSEEFGGLGNPFVDVLREAGLSTPVTRATVRSVAASDPDLIEEALAYAGPSEALLAAAPSLEQVWGGRAYSASGWTGTGLAGTTALGRGVPTVVSYAENAFAVYVLSEHGVLGGMSVLLLYLALLGIVGVWILRVREHIHRSPAGLAGLALTVGSVLWLVLPAAYVAASNLGLLPLTGQNMPFLGLNSWADVVLVCGIGTGVFVTLAGLGEWSESTDPFPRSAAEVS